VAVFNHLVVRLVICKHWCKNHDFHDLIWFDFWAPAPWMILIWGASPYQTCDLILIWGRQRHEWFWFGAPAHIRLVIWFWFGGASAMNDFDLGRQRHDLILIWFEGASATIWVWFGAPAPNQTTPQALGKGPVHNHSTINITIGINI
jgi:hypothetical protein